MPQTLCLTSISTRLAASQLHTFNSFPAWQQNNNLPLCLHVVYLSCDGLSTSPLCSIVHSYFYYRKDLTVCPHLIGQCCVLLWFQLKLCFSSRTGNTLTNSRSKLVGIAIFHYGSLNAGCILALQLKFSPLFCLCK